MGFGTMLSIIMTCVIVFRYVYHINHAIAALRRTTMIIAMSLASAELADLWGVVRNAQLIQVYFPGWTLRVYAKKPVTSATDSDSESIYATVISKLFALGADIVYVDTALTGIAAKWWSYMAVDDLNVDFALVRKPNSRLGEREAMAIKDWIHLCEKSRHVAVHCIRDSAYQGSRPMMHGLWGARPRVLHQLLGGHSLISLIDNFVNDSHRHDDELEPSDFLSQVLWPLVMPDSVVCHDSVTYDVWPNSHRFDHSQSQCVGAEYDAHEQTIAHCERHDLSLSNMVDIDDRLQLLV